MNTSSATPFLLVALLSALVPADLMAAPFGKPVPEGIRGMTVSCPRSGQIWGTPAMAEALAELTPLGVNWVSIHPYGRIGRDGSVRYRGRDELAYLDHAARYTRDAGVSLFWIPHLAYWGSYEWRGDIQYGDDEEAWHRFFEQYQSFIVAQARMAAENGAALFSLGVELDATTHREAPWRRIIAAVREVYPGPITYAANWDSLERVPFWDAVDLIGVQAYFPLASASIQDPDRKALLAGWEGPLAQVRELSRRFGKPVVFTEIGYTRSPQAAALPWDNATTDTPETRELRRRLMEVALERLSREGWLAGMFWWKWMAGEPHWHDRDFSMKDPEARETLARYWGGGKRGAEAAKE
jgi:hypothetical protein